MFFFGFSLSAPELTTMPPPPPHANGCSPQKSEPPPVPGVGAPGADHMPRELLATFCGGKLVKIIALKNGWNYIVKMCSA